jgi:hypothetical protein
MCSGLTKAKRNRQDAKHSPKNAKVGTHLVVYGIQPARDEVPMFMHNAMSFAARKELLDYGYKCGRAAAPGLLAILHGAVERGSSSAA